MQKFWNIASPIIILGLGVFAYYLYTKIAVLEAKIAELIPPVSTAGNRTSVSGGELWDAVQNKVQEMKIDLTFKNNNQ